MTSTNPTSITSAAEHVDTSMPFPQPPSASLSATSASTAELDDSALAQLSRADLHAVLRLQRARFNNQCQIAALESDIQRREDQLRHKAELRALEDRHKAQLRDAQNATLRAKTLVLNLEKEIKELKAANQA